jgi:hypothetical protein
MTWSLNYARDPERVATLTALSESASPRWDGIGSSGGMGQEPHRVRAGAWFTGGPGREREAAEAWAFEMKAHFMRGAGEPPVVTYANGTYTVIGMIQTTHPADDPSDDGIVWFT